MDVSAIAINGNVLELCPDEARASGRYPTAYLLHRAPHLTSFDLMILFTDREKMRTFYSVADSEKFEANRIISSSYAL